MQKILQYIFNLSLFILCNNYLKAWHLVLFIIFKVFTAVGKSHIRQVNIMGENA